MLLRSLKSRALALARVGESITLLHDLLGELRQELHEQTQAWKSLVHRHELLLRERANLASVMLLWDPSRESGELPRSSGFASVTLPIGDQTIDGHMQCVVPVPDNAWLVASGCLLKTVIVGHDLMDLNGSKPSNARGAPAVRLSKPVALGVLVRFQMVPLHVER